MNLKGLNNEFPELEELIRVITAILNADMHKANDYSVGLSTAGILAVKSKMNPQLFRSFCVKLKLPARPCATYRGRLCPVGRARGASVIQDWIEVRWPNWRMIQTVGLLVTSPEFHRKIAQQKRHCRAKPMHTTHRGIVWPASKAWQARAQLRCGVAERFRR